MADSANDFCNEVFVAKVQKSWFVFWNGALFVGVCWIGVLEFCREKRENAFLGAKFGILQLGNCETASGQASRAPGWCKSR